MTHHRTSTHRALRAVTAAAVVALGLAVVPSAATAADADTGWLAWVICPRTPRRSTSRSPHRTGPPCSS